MDKCFRCCAEMRYDKDTYFDSIREIILLRDCLKCPECGEIMYTLEQTKEFQERLRGMNLIGEKPIGVEV